MNKIICVFFTLVIWTVLFVSSVHGSWAYMFVVNNGNLYVISDGKVDLKQIGSKIGEVTNYSTQEVTYSGNFLNRYQSGTEYYQIKGVNPKENEGV